MPTQSACQLGEQFSNVTNPPIPIQNSTKQSTPLKTPGFFSISSSIDPVQVKAFNYIIRPPKITRPRRNQTLGFEVVLSSGLVPSSAEIELDRVSMPGFLGEGPTSTGGKSGSEGLLEIAEERGRVIEFERDMAADAMELRLRRPKRGDGGGEMLGELTIGDGAVSGGGQNSAEILGVKEVLGFQSSGTSVRSKTHRSCSVVQCVIHNEYSKGTRYSFFSINLPRLTEVSK